MAHTLDFACDTRCVKFVSISNWTRPVVLSPEFQGGSHRWDLPTPFAVPACFLRSSGSEDNRKLRCENIEADSHSSGPHNSPCSLYKEQGPKKKA